MSMIEIGVVFCAAAVAVLLALFVLGFLFRRASKLVTSDENPIAFLFNGDALVHAAPGSMSIFDEPTESTDWMALRKSMLARFPEFPSKTPTDIGTTLEIPATDPDDKAFLRIQTFGEHARVEVVETTPQEIIRTNHELKMLKARHNQLERICNSAPYPMWHTDEKGELIWANTAYEALVTQTPTDNSLAGNRPGILEVVPTSNEPCRARASVTLDSKPAPSWFDVTATPQRDGTISHATNIDAVIHAEIAQRNFVQTLAKTFAQLSIGLAIFDRNGQLALFNPALVSLSGLPAIFLSTRPDLLTFFDRLRDNRMMPEPKNYASWRQEIANLIKAASDGTYEETWTLDTGLTYRVCGRPHPDGAVAFLIEDISAEISLTRNFRAELELGQSILDTDEDGLVVFSSSGTLTYCNKAYRDVWKVDPDNSFADMTIGDSIKIWSSACHPNPAWGDIREFVMKIGERAAWDTWIDRLDGSKVLMTVSPIASGATVLRFDTCQSYASLPASQPDMTVAKSAS